jgi:transposase
MKWNYYVGIDVSKNYLDYALLKGSELILNGRIDNNEQGIISLIEQLKKKEEDFTLAECLFCMEYTGIYNNPCIYYLKEKDADICLESGRHIKLSGGLQRGKNDKIDALRIAQYAYKNREGIKLWTPKRQALVRLSALSTLRRRLVGILKELKTPVKAGKNFVEKEIHKEQVKLCSKSIKATEKDIETIEKKMNQLIKKDEILNRLFNIITSVDGIGDVTAVEIILTTNEFKDIKEPKKFACYSGVAPFEYSSGKSIRGKNKVSPMANKTMKSILHMAALSSINMKGEMRVYFERKVAEGKNKMLILNAIRNKLIHRIFACVNQNREYEKIYTNALA